MESSQIFEVSSLDPGGAKSGLAAISKVLTHISRAGRFRSKDAHEIKHLMLAGNDIGDSEIQALRGALEADKIEILDLENNRIGPSGAEFLSTFVGQALRKLNLSRIGFYQFPNHSARK